jgi:hypothetical protein
MSAKPDQVLVDGVLSEEKLDQLLAVACELPELDYKAHLDLSKTRDLVELAKDVGAMQVLGGYILVGVSAPGAPSGMLDTADLRGFDEANLTPRLLKWLSVPLSLRTRVATRDGHEIVMIYVAPHPAGCAFFRSDGRYRAEGGREVLVFRAGDVYWRDGTRSVRMSQEGLEAVIERRVAEARSDFRADDTAEEPLVVTLRRLLGEGRRIRATATIPLDGACALFEVWEHQLVSVLEMHERHDVATRLTANTPVDVARGLWSERWRTKGRMDRVLQELARLVERGDAVSATGTTA